MANITSVTQTNTFKKAVKKLKANQKEELDEAVREIMQAPDLGEKKKGDLRDLRVYKFKMVNQLTLLGYQYTDGDIVLHLITFGPHENFYRDVKKIL